jgi:hypothetical protein
MVQSWILHGVTAIALPSLPILASDQWLLTKKNILMAQKIGITQYAALAGSNDLRPQTFCECGVVLVNARHLILS